MTRRGRRYDKRKTYIKVAATGYVFWSNDPGLYLDYPRRRGGPKWVWASKAEFEAYHNIPAA